MKQKYYPISTLQKPFWIAQKANPTSAAYSITRVYKLRGKLNIKNLEECISEMIRRYEILRVTFHQVDEQIMQRINQPFNFQIECIDARMLTDDSVEMDINRYRKEFEVKSWDLENGPLFYLRVIELNDETFWVLFNFNHIIFDAFSIILFENELTRLYQQYPDYNTVQQFPYQYNHYVEWELKHSFNEIKSKEIYDFYKSYLDNIEPVNFNLSRRQLSEVSSHEADLVGYELPPKFVGDINHFLKKHKLSKLAFYASVLYLLIARQARTDDITLGMPVANRHQTEMLKMLGLFINTVLLRQAMNPDLTFLEFCHSVNDNRHKMQQYDTVLYNNIVNALKPKKILNRNSFFDILFNFTTNPFSHIFELSDCKTLAEDFNSSETGILLTWYLILRNDSVILGCKSLLEIIDYKTIGILFWQYHTLLNQIISNPEKKLSSYSLLFPPDIDSYHRKLIKDPTRTADYSNYYYFADQVRLPDPTHAILQEKKFTVHGLIQHVAKLLPDHPAIVNAEKSWTYSNLITNAMNLFADLMKKNINKHDVVAIHGDMSFGLCASVIGSWISGAVILLIDPSHPAEYKRRMLLESKAKYLMNFTSQFDNEILPKESSITLIQLDPDALLHNLDVHPKIPEISPDDPCYIFFTSGTTGRPKGIKGTHKGLSHFLDWQRIQFNIDPNDRCGQITNLSFDVVLREIFTPLISGATIYIPPSSNRIESGKYFEWADTNKITIQHIVPSLARVLMQNTPNSVALKSLRWLFFAGEPLSKNLVQEWRAKFPQSGNLVNLYGPTETTLAKMFYIVPKEFTDNVQPIGNPIPQTQVIILNQDRQQCGVGEVGEICIRTPYRTMGYINPSLTDAERFIQNPFRDDPDDIIYLSGDLGFALFDGTICICGRVDEQVKINGIRVDPVGIADMISQQTSVEHCAVIGKKNNEGKVRLIAYVVPKNDLPQDELKHSILQELHGKLPSYMIPRDVIFLDKLPLTARGKLDKKALPEPQDAAVTQTIHVSQREPSSPLELDLAEYWKRILKISQLFMEDDFFDLGGDSLDGVQMIIHIQQHYNIDIKLHDLISNPKLFQLVEYIEGGRKSLLNNKMTLMELKQFIELPQLSKLPHRSRTSDTMVKTRKIFITGAAGFLGSYLLNKLIDVNPSTIFYCLIRAKDASHGLSRITDAFTKNKLKNINKLESRIMPVIGDLAKPNFGLTQEAFDQLCQDIDVIYHSGALVNFVYTFNQLKLANIDGTKTVIELAHTARLKPIHYISTAGIYPAQQRYEDKIINDDDVIGDGDDVLIGGYAQSKWVADQLMQKARSAGIPINIYRPGRVSWDANTGNWQEEDAIFRFIFGCIQLGYIPDLPVTLDLNPVNMVSDAIINIANNNQLLNSNFNIVNPNRINITDFVCHLREANIHIKVIPYPEWLNKLHSALNQKEQNVLFPLLDLFAPSLEDMPRLRYNRYFDCKNFQYALKDTDIAFPEIDFNFLSQFIKHIPNI